MSDIRSTLSLTATPSGRALVPIRVGGAHRGARLLQPALAAYNQDSSEHELAIEYVDPVPGRAPETAAEARRLGLTATYREARIEDVIEAEQQAGLLVFTLDRPAATARGLAAAASNGCAVTGGMLIAVPTGTLFGFGMVLPAEDSESKRLGSLFMDQLDRVTARRGASAVFGERGRPEHIAAEPAYRHWFASLMTSNLPKLVTGLEPEASPFSLTPDGRITLALLITDNRTGWAEPAELAKEIVSDPPQPLVRGEDFAVGEIGPDGIRIHIVRLRKLDGKVALQASAVIDRASVDAAVEQERLERLAERALMRAKRSTMTRTFPAVITD